MTGTDLHGALVRLLNDLETLRRSLRLYPASHPALQPARERIRARVLALADTFDLLFTARGGRGMLTREGTVAWLADREGSMLDPGWASALREVIQRPAGAHPPG